jgi:signal transduction histidine kinase
LEQQLERLRSLNPQAVDAVLAGAFLVITLVTVYTQDVIRGLSDPPLLAVGTIVLGTAPIAMRRRRPLLALTLSSVAVLLHVSSSWPEGAMPMATLLLTYTVAAWDTPRQAAVGLGVVYLVLVILGMTDTPGLDTLGVVANLAIFTVAWTVGIALRARREALDSRVREAEERAEGERQRAARALAEERLRIAQELHDVVAHSMSVIAVQAGAGAHVCDERPEQARAALEAISVTARGTLTELRQLLGALRDVDGARTSAPAPGLADLPRLVEDVAAAGVPVTLTVTGEPPCECTNAGVELSAYRVVQEALTNVIKHAGSPTRVEVRIGHLPGSLSVEVVDDGRGAATLATVGVGSASGAAGGAGPDEPSGGHGLLGMRERVELWGGDLDVGPVPGGGFRVSARLPYGEVA